jgi:hypothetical protein
MAGTCGHQVEEEFSSVSVSLKKFDCLEEENPQDSTIGGSFLEQPGHSTLTAAGNRRCLVRLLVPECFGMSTLQHSHENSILDSGIPGVLPREL